MAGAGDGIPVLLVTANVGSIFEETVLRLDPKFIALHCQEVGGKNYEQSMKHVEEFVRLLMSSEELRLFDKIRVFLDEDYSSAEHFTALGNLYFVHDSLKEILLWDFKECVFVPVDGKEIHSGNIEAVTTKEKAKFPQDFFPECKWSRKGFLRTRWNISGTVFDLINIHLFHDASNFIAMETFPSVYSKTRRRALEHTLDRFHNDQYVNVPYFLFGDFNFRTDTAGVIKKLTEDTQERKFSSKGNISKLQFRNKEDDLILTLGKKEFSHCEHQNVFMENGGKWLREYDREMEDFEGRLFEFPIKFVPSYPFEEDINEATNYMKTRVPAWCDRVLLSPTAKTLVQNVDSSDAVEYGIIGPMTCMGDHKPVYLRIMMAANAGTIDCCRLISAPEHCFRVAASYVESLSIMPDCHNCANARGLYAGERSSNLLHAVPIKHDPYTPDSMDSPSPNAITASGEVPEVLSNRRDVCSAVSPALLKSRLELIIQSTRQKEHGRSQEAGFKGPSPSDSQLSSDASFGGSRKRRNRSNSDLCTCGSRSARNSWLNAAKPLHRGFRSFDEIDREIPAGDLQLDIVIPRIAIINASNFESDESSVYPHEDKINAKAEGMSISRNNDEETEKIRDENGTRNNRFTDTKENRTNCLEIANLPNDDVNVDKRIHTSFPIYDTNENLQSQMKEDSTNCVDVTNTIEEQEKDVEEFGKKCAYPAEGYSKTVSSVKSSRRIEPEESTTSVDLKRTRTVNEEKDEDMGEQKSIVKKALNTRKPSGNDIEVLKTDSKQETVPSKNSTRSNSIESQDAGDNGGSVKLKLKAYKVTERYTNNIVGKQGKCHKCCCAVS